MKTTHQTMQFLTMKYCTFILIFAATLASGTLRAQGPNLINYQGRVLVGTVNFDGSGQFKFALVNAAGTTTYWSNNGTSVGGSEPSAAVSLTVIKGLYSVLLGDTSFGANMTAIPTTVFAQTDLRLRVWFNDGTNGSQRLSPDQRLAPTAYLAASSVTTGTIADAAISGPKIAAGAVSGTQVAANTLDASRFAVVGPPNAGQVLGFNGTGLTWTASGGGVFSLNGTNAYYNGGNVGIGTTTPTLRLAISGGPAWTSNGWGGSLQLDNGYAIGWPANTAGQRFGMGHTNGGLAFFRTASDLGNTGSPALVDLWLNDSGNVGIGTIAPTLRLAVSGGPAWTSNGWGGSLQLNNGYAIGWPANTAGQRFGMGHTNGGFAFFRTASDLGTTGSPAVSDLFINDSGNVGIGTIAPATKLHLYNPTNSLSELIETGGSTNAFAQLIFRTLDGGWLMGTSQNFNNDDLYFAREGGSTYAFAIETNGDAFLQGTMSCKVLTIRGGADVAEPFEVQEEGIEKGSVVVIDEKHPGSLKRSRTAYDTRVAGIVSGANGIHPGIALQQEGALEGGQDVALSGRVYVRADTSSGPIKPGDLLTTSNNPGSAMRVTDHRRAQGAVIGKAMSSLNEGSGMVLVLVTLQ